MAAVTKIPTITLWFFMRLAALRYELLQPVVIPAVEFLRRAERQKPALIQHGKLVCNLARPLDVVGDNHHGGMTLCFDFHEKGINLRGGDSVQSAGGLIHQ